MTHKVYLTLYRLEIISDHQLLGLPQKKFACSHMWLLDFGNPECINQKCHIIETTVILCNNQIFQSCRISWRGVTYTDIDCELDAVSLQFLSLQNEGPVFAICTHKVGGKLDRLQGNDSSVDTSHCEQMLGTVRIHVVLRWQKFGDRYKERVSLSTGSRLAHWPPWKVSFDCCSRVSSQRQGSSVLRYHPVKSLQSIQLEYIQTARKCTNYLNSA